MKSEAGLQKKPAAVTVVRGKQDNRYALQKELIVMMTRGDGIRFNA
jgi:hypothetical protein